MLQSFVDAINKIGINVYAVFIILLGSGLAIHGQPSLGGTLITGGFALLRSEVTTVVNNIPPSPKV